MKSDLFVSPTLWPSSGQRAVNNNFDLFFLSKIKGLSQGKIWQYYRDKNWPVLKSLVEQNRKDKNFLELVQTEFYNIDEDYISILDDAYPKNLKNIYDPPLFLFYRGQLDLLKSKYLVTIVGSRSITSYHTSSTVNLISAFRNQPLIIVSGLAFGIDSLAHQEALNSKLKTIAVLGSELSEEVIYPKENIRLAKNILNSGGLLLSEYSKHTKPMLHHFPKRNRILAGLSKATIVISGAAKSGTLITAQVALDEGREVYALPGNINQLLSQGPNNLIKSGANILLGAQEILSLYNIEGSHIEKKIKFNDQLQAKAYSLLQIEALSSAQLATKLNLSLAQVNSIVSEFELLGLVKSNQFNQIEIK